MKLREYFTRERLRKIIFYALYIFIALIVQEIVLSGLRLGKYYAFLLPSIAVALGMFEGSFWGSMLALVLGLFTDLMYPETVIMYMILFPATAFTVGFLVRFFLNRSFLAYMGSAFICLIVTGLVQGLKVLMTDSFTVEVFVTVVVQTLISLPLAALCYFPPMRFRESLS
jgi:cell shape-determining protein MreD